MVTVENFSRPIAILSKHSKGVQIELSLIKTDEGIVFKTIF